jgi:fructose transport system ATP-binding protein
VTSNQNGTSDIVLEARGLKKMYGHVTAIADGNFELRAGEVMAVVGDNGAGKSSLIKAITGALVPDAGEVRLNGKPVHFKSPLDSRLAGIETVYQELAVAPQLDIASNMFLGREVRKTGIAGKVFRNLDKARMRREAAANLSELGITTLQSITQRVETLSGGQRQAVAVARSAAWARNVIIMDEPTAALGVRETGQVLQLIEKVKAKGLPVVLISHSMPDVFQVADRIHIHRLGRREAIVSPKDVSMQDVVALITGALTGADVKSAMSTVENT